jgi:hypothetical protein
MKPEELERILVSLDDGDLFGLLKFIGDELQQRSEMYRIQLAATDKAEEARLPF